MNMTNLTKSEKAVLYALHHAGGTIKNRTKLDWTEWEEHLPIRLHRHTIRTVIDGLVKFRGVAVAEWHLGPKAARRSLELVRLNDHGYRWVEREHQVFKPFDGLLDVPYSERPTGRDKVITAKRPKADKEAPVAKRYQRGSDADFVRWFWDTHQGAANSSMLQLSGEYDGSRHKAQGVYNRGFLTAEPVAHGGARHDRLIELSDKGLELLATLPEREVEPALNETTGLDTPTIDTPMEAETDPEPFTTAVTAELVAAALLDQVVAIAQDSVDLGDQVRELQMRLDERGDRLAQSEATINELREHISSLIATIEGLEDRLKVAQDENVRRAATQLASRSTSYVEKLARRIGGTG